MSIFFVTAYLGQPHGSAKSARDFARALLAVRDKICIVSPWTEDFGLTAAGYPLAKPRWYKYVRRGAWSLTSALSILSIFRNRLRRWRICSAMQGQRVIVNGWASYAYWKELAVTGYKSTSIIVRESPRHFEFRDKGGSFEAMLAGFSEFDCLIFVSDRLRQEWTQQADLASKTCLFLPNCCEEEHIARIKQSSRQKTRHQLGFLDDDFVVICPGSIEQRKGQDIVLKALPEIVETIPNIKVLLLGDASTDWGRSLISEVDKGGYGEHVVSMPAQSSAIEYLYAADVLLFPSRAEALPRTILEGMALGIPIVASAVDGIPELIEDGVSGWLFPRDDSVRMMDRLRAAAFQPVERDKLATQAEQRYRRNFSRRMQIERVDYLLSWLEAE